MTSAVTAGSDVYKRQDWKSDITVWINGHDCGTWQCPGDFGARRGRLNPPWWESGATQYGLLTTVTVTGTSTLINNEVSSSVRLSDLSLQDNCWITVRIGNKEDAEYPVSYTHLDVYKRQSWVCTAMGPPGSSLYPVSGCLLDAA